MRTTTVEIFLPSAGEMAQSNRGTVVRVSGQQHPSGTILVVEDEESLRCAVSKLLRRKGFRVIEALDGNSALALLDEHKEIDTVLLDLTLPGASSREVFEEAQRAHPNVKVILTSAYSKETVDSSFSGLRVEHFIRKPFQLADLMGMLPDVRVT